MKLWLERTWRPISWVGLILLICPILGGIATSVFDFYPQPPLDKLFSVPWYYFTAVSIVFFVGSAFAWRQVDLEVERQQQLARKAKEEMWNKWYAAFHSGSVSEYPRVIASSFGYPLRPDELGYLATELAVLGRGSAHQLEISESSDAGVDLRGVKFGQAAGTKDSYSTIRYDENHPGTLLITNQRVSFISAPSVFLDLLPREILAVAWNGQFVMMRTNLSIDDSKNLIAIRIAGDLPSWLFASAIFRLIVDNAPPTAPVNHPPTDSA
jgi:hypothetical protein